MQITKQYDWHRRDFYFDAKCEHCGVEVKKCDGYDDRNFYENVIPERKCKSCGESSKSKQSEVPLAIVQTKYSEFEII